MILISWSERDSRALPEGGDADSITTTLLELDIAEQDAYDVATTVTSHAVEVGVPITDHVIPAQDRVTFTAYISDRQSSTRIVEGSRHGETDIGGGLKATGIVVPEGTSRITDVHSTMRRLCREGIAVDVDGLRRPLEEWIIESVSSPRNVETSGLLAMDVTLVEVRYAEAEEVEAPSPRVERGRRNRNRGRQATGSSETDEVSTAPEDRAQAQSTLAAGYDWTGGLF